MLVRGEAGIEHREHDVRADERIHLGQVDRVNRLARATRRRLRVHHSDMLVCHRK